MSSRKYKSLPAQSEQPQSSFVDANAARESFNEKVAHESQQVEQFAEAVIAAPQEPAPPVQRGRRREPIEFIVPNGVKVTMGWPPEAIQYRLARIYKKDLADDLSQQYAKAQFFIRALNDQPVPLPNNRLDLERVANMLETDGLDQVVLAFVEYFETTVDLNLVKK